MLFFVVAYLAPSSGLAFVIYRWIKSRDLVMVARTDAARGAERLAAAREATLEAEEGRRAAQDQAQEALAQTGQALELARNIESVGHRVQGLTDYLVGKLEGLEGEVPAQRVPGRHERQALPAGSDWPSLSDDHLEGRFLP
jgi:hypothetical protein